MRIALHVHTRQTDYAGLLHFIRMGVNMKIGSRILIVNYDLRVNKKIIPDQDEPSLFPNVLAGISENHQMAFLGSAIAVINDQPSPELAISSCASKYLRGMSFVSEINFNPSIWSSGLLEIPFSSLSLGSWLSTI